MVLKDSLFSQEKNKEITRKEMNYEFEKKEAKARAEQDKKDAVTAEQSRREKLIRYSVIGGLALMFIIAVVIFRALRITRKQKLIIEIQSNLVAQQKQTVEEQKQHLEEKQKEILDSIRYAKRIQEALLPTKKYIDRTLKKLKK